MKKVTSFIFIFFLLVTNCFSQSAEKDKYITKAKNQGTYAWLLAFSGTVLHIVGFALETSGPLIDLNETPEEQQSRKRKERTGNILIVAGTAAFIGSIPFFISSHKNHKRSLRVAIDMKPFNQLKSNNIYASGYPALTLKIGL